MSMTSKSFCHPMSLWLALHTYTLLSTEHFHFCVIWVSQVNNMLQINCMILPKLPPPVNFFLSYIFILLHDTTIHPIFQGNHLRSTNTFIPSLNLYLLLLKYLSNEFKSFQLQNHCLILDPRYLLGGLFQWSSNPFSILQLQIFLKLTSFMLCSPNKLLVILFPPNFFWLNSHYLVRFTLLHTSLPLVCCSFIWLIPVHP